MWLSGCSLVHPKARLHLLLQTQQHVQLHVTPDGWRPLSHSCRVPLIRTGLYRTWECTAWECTTWECTACRAVDLALSVGIFPYVLKLLQTTSNDLRATLVFIWAKILALDRSCQVLFNFPHSAGYSIHSSSHGSVAAVLSYRKFGTVLGHRQACMQQRLVHQHKNPYKCACHGHTAWYVSQHLYGFVPSHC